MPYNGLGELFPLQQGHQKHGLITTKLNYHLRLILAPQMTLKLVSLFLLLFNLYKSRSNPSTECKVKSLCPIPQTHPLLSTLAGNVQAYSNVFCTHENHVLQFILLTVTSNISPWVHTRPQCVFTVHCWAAMVE